MSPALEVAQIAGVSVGGAAFLLAALYGRKALKAGAKVGTVATFGICFLVLVGFGALVGWWTINLGTIAEHGSLIWEFVAGLADELL